MSEFRHNKIMQSPPQTYFIAGRQLPKNMRYLEPYLTDIPRQREEYEVIYGTRRNAECHITSILRAGVEYLFYFMTNSRYIFVTK